MVALRICSVEGCGNSARTKSLCNSHYARLRRHGNPLGGNSKRAKTLEAAIFFRDIVLNYEGGECLLWPFAKSSGYGIIRINDRNERVHRLACVAEHGPAPSLKHEAAHLCGNGHIGCCARKHLAWKTPVQNQADRITHGTHNRGTRQGRSKLTEADVIEIRRLASHKTQSQIADQFGVARTTIELILIGKNWAWLP